MNIEIICVGTLKEKYWKDAESEYTKRLSRYVTIKIKEVREVALPKNAGFADEENVKKAEGKSILSALPKQSYVIALDIWGKRLGSEKLAGTIRELGLSGKSTISFIIGGSLGLSKEVLDAADMRLSFSEMTFPHQLMRIILLEQVYRSYKILNNETYHK